VSETTEETGKDPLFAEKCPECGGPTLRGFGLMGGGYGPYVFCASEVDAQCDWMFKRQEKVGDE